MIDKAALKKAVCAAIDEHQQIIIDIGETILRNPETGFKEFETARLVAEYFEELDLKPETGLAITGVKGRLNGSKSGPVMALIGELDALKVANHPFANAETHAAHACGHNAQIAGLIGSALGLKSSGVMESLAGAVVFFAVPAEESIEIEYRLRLREEKKLELTQGKAELIRLGHFDDIDMAMMIHAKNIDECATQVFDSSNGSVIKRVSFIGKEAHAGAKPQAGLNALNAATLALSAIHFQRETFYDDDTVRIHPIITKGGDAVNVVPAEVNIETYVRGKNIEAILDANRKVDRALRSGAMAIGVDVEIHTIPGPMPVRSDKDMTAGYGENAELLFGPNQIQVGGHVTGSTDMGDVCHIMPAIHPFLRGVSGDGHTKEYAISDPYEAYVAPAKLMAMTAIDMLYDDAGAAKKIIAENKPAMTKDAYLTYKRDLFNSEHYRPEPL